MAFLINAMPNTLFHAVPDYSLSTAQQVEWRRVLVFGGLYIAVFLGWVIWRLRKTGK